MAILINVDHIASSFKARLENENQKRLIVSGVFGIGKTTFIRHFFSRESEFFHIHLFPVNYSVAKNEDIFELIKFDILYELIKEQSINLTKKDISWFDTFKTLTGDDIYKILSSFVGLIPKFGKNIQDVIEGLKKITEVFRERKEAEQKKSELQMIVEYASRVENTTGSIYENDFYTQLITSCIEKIKQRGKTIVLTIDDLDRVDPDHIFRILNVFAAHFDIDENHNKFGIDRIILCCDIDNIRKIFNHKYGPDVDFSGYINKFYTKGIFYFNNTSNTIQIVESILTILNLTSQTATNKLLNSRNYVYTPIFGKILKGLIQSGAITPREIFKHHGEKYTIPEITVDILGDKYKNHNFPLFTIFEFILDMYGDTKNFIHAIDRIDMEIQRNNEIDYERYFGELIFLSKIITLNKNELRGYSNDKIMNYIINGETLSFAIGRSSEYLWADLANEKGNQIIQKSIQKELLMTAVKNYVSLRREY